jgi:hypothetical protein
MVNMRTFHTGHCKISFLKMVNMNLFVYSTYVTVEGMAEVGRIFHVLFELQVMCVYFHLKTHVSCLGIGSSCEKETNKCSHLESNHIM